MTPRLNNFLRGWLLVLGIKEGLVECATVCVKSVVILKRRVINHVRAFTMVSFGRGRKLSIDTARE